MFRRPIAQDYPWAAFPALLIRTEPLSHPSQLPASPSVDRKLRIRPVAAAVMFGGVAGIAIGCAYLGGVTARATTVRAQAERLQGASNAGFTEEALSAAAGGLDASALAIARRHDPYTVAGAAQRDRQAELLSARLEQLRPAGDPMLRRVSLNTPFADAAGGSALRLDHALDAARDLDCLTQAVYYEARGEGRDGMKAVAQVVLNRVRHPAFPKTVCGVVFQGAARSSGCQFSFTCSGVMRGRVNRAAWNRSRDIATKALSGQVFSGVGSATHFHTTGVAPGWRNSLVQVSQVGQHLFYRFGSGRPSPALTYAARPAQPERPRLIQAGIDPVETARRAGQAVAYSLALAQDGVKPETPPATAVSTSVPAAAPAPAPRAAKPVERPPETAPAKPEIAVAAASA